MLIYHKFVFKSEENNKERAIEVAISQIPKLEATHRGKAYLKRITQMKDIK